jgi:curved DNA-binding protein CbpA
VKGKVAVDYYAVLDVQPTADQDAIRRAYRSLARRLHPDMPGGSDADMRTLNAAWAVLRDPATRRTYDLRRTARSTVAEPSPVVARPATQPTDDEVIDYGRYAGTSLAELARSDPDYLLWLARTPAGRRYQGRIEELLARPPAAGRTPPRDRRGLARRLAQSVG